VASWLLAAAAALGLGAGLAACGSGHKSAAAPSTTTAPASTVHPRSTSTTTTSPPTTTTAPPTTTTTTTTAPPTTTTTTAPAPPASLSACTSSHLAATLTSPQGAAGTTYYHLELTNTGSKPCTLYGYPGVSFVAGAAGAQVGAAAEHATGVQPVATVTLDPGAFSVATLGIVDAGNYPPSCQITSASGLRVYPPGNVAALFIPTSGISTCANSADVTLRVGPMTAG